MTAKRKTKKKMKVSAKRKAAPKKKTVKAKKKMPKRKAVVKLVKKTPVQPFEPVPTVQENTDTLEERQEQFHDAEDAIVDEADEEELGEAV